ncbi:hypothetical protein CC1G_02642 [Coprinopsis cinerea okayama7|uniref:Uncharacterized protein n=1 Tax=Coprinopsis cinerea (strain Okayama-7 / 130 / ATCC MYA-4618 / FGSC 9003) TaxID=240176 RepID=A8PBG7_COPC7|nr:hypothetical protein CC1G_02642 [Coprinopsis cinerea okayama7\|eukprot:XP_001840179.2 hypothetical protein CC1G_02642 [Coprinopsis cinerea okayama7\
MISKIFTLFTALSIALCATQAAPTNHEQPGMLISPALFDAQTAPAHELPIHKAPVHELPIHKAPIHIPVHKAPGEIVVPKHLTFDRWGGFDSLKGFDNFYGIDNFDGHRFNQVLIKPKHELVCRVQRVEIVQQRLLVLQELAKRIITEKVCEVEAQTILFEQFHGGLRSFERDLLRLPGAHEVGYDEKIVGHFPKFFNEDGSLNDDDWGFTGHELGRHTVIVGGHNWDDSRSFRTVRDAWHNARNAWARFW